MLNVETIVENQQLMIKYLKESTHNNTPHELIDAFPEMVRTIWTDFPVPEPHRTELIAMEGPTLGHPKGEISAKTRFSKVRISHPFDKSFHEIALEVREDILEEMQKDLRLNPGIQYLYCPYVTLTTTILHEGKFGILMRYGKRAIPRYEEVIEKQ